MKPDMKALEAKDKEIATQKGMRQNLDTEIMELNKEIARLKQRIKELEKDSCAVCFNDGRQQALEEAIYTINYSEDLMDAINRVRALKEFAES